MRARQQPVLLDEPGWMASFPDSLQRAIHHGLIPAKRGRTTEQLAAITGALSLLANIVMAWNTHRLQGVLDRAPAAHPDTVSSRVTPIGHKHINLRGIMTFDLSRHGPSLLGRTISAGRDQAMGARS